MSLLLSGENMKYSDAREFIQSGDLICLSHQSWKRWNDVESQIVKCATQSEFSHVCVAWVVGARVFAIEAVVPKVRIMPVSNMLEDGVYWIPMHGKPMTEAELEFGLSHVGLGTYSKWEAICAQLNKLSIGSSKYWECAELVICMRKLSGLDLGGKATPAAVVKEALKQGYELKFLTKE